MSDPRLLRSLLIGCIVLSCVPSLSAETHPPTAHKNSPAQRGFLGFLFGFHQVSESLKVLQLYPGGPAENAGLKVGDVVVAFNSVRFKFTSEVEARQAFDWIKPGESVDLTIVREGKESVLTIEASELPEPIRRENAEMLEVALGSASNGTLQHILDTNQELVLEKLADGSIKLSAAGSSTPLDDVLRILTARHRIIRDVIVALAPGERSRMRISRTDEGGIKFESIADNPDSESEDSH